MIAKEPEFSEKALQALKAMFNADQEAALRETLENDISPLDEANFPEPTTSEETPTDPDYIAAAKYVDEKINEYRKQNENEDHTRSIFPAATSRIKGKTFSDNEWWEAFQATLDHTFPLDESKAVQEIARNLLFRKLGIYDENNKLTEDADKKLRKPGQINEQQPLAVFFIIQSPIFPNVFVQYSVTEARNDNHSKIVGFDIKEHVTRVPNAVNYNNSFRDSPIKSRK